MYRKFIKRQFDIVFSLLGLCVLIVPMLIISVCIKIDSPGKVLFFQSRVGINKTTFRIIKFRTMKIDAPHDIPTNEIDQPSHWITDFGKFLRKTSLDELPQLFNILLGNMSLVGPRPVVPAEQDLICERDKYGANSIRPGLTGLAQINGRDRLDYRTKAQFDGEYVRNISLRLDVKCLILTLSRVIRHTDILQ